MISRFQNSGFNSVAFATAPRQGPFNQVWERNLFSGINSGINFDKYEEIPVKATGIDVPRPCIMFEDLHLHPVVQENIRKSGYVKPTPVQKYSIPALMNCRDLMSCAQTGSGKTAAFLVPIINHIIFAGPQIVQPSRNRMVSPNALILSPTRELAMQTHREALKFSYCTGVTSAVLYGGRENYRDQLHKLQFGCRILIATPGRLLDVINQDVVSLRDCFFLVLDEADRMLDMGFEPQIRQIVELHSMPPKENRVTAMFSATFPKDIQILAQDFLRTNYVFLAVGRVGSTSENIIQKVLWVEEHDKKRMLMNLLDTETKNGLTLVFVQTKKGANDLACYLQQRNYNVVPIHGDLKQHDRERHLEMFRSGKTSILVATAIAARGLDIPNVNHVINFDLPTDIDDYVHRIGRTGRAGNVGFATAFFTDRNWNICRDLVALLMESNQEVPKWLDKMSKEGTRSGASDRIHGGDFGGRDHRLEFSAESTFSNTNHSTPSVCQQGNQINIPTYFNYSTSILPPSFSQGDIHCYGPRKAVVFGNFQNSAYQAPQIQYVYSSHGQQNIFSSRPFESNNYASYWANNIPHIGGFPQPGAPIFGNNFGVQLSHATFGNWQ